jgi:hypothetical protein
VGYRLGRDDDNQLLPMVACQPFLVDRSLDVEGLDTGLFDRSRVEQLLPERRLNTPHAVQRAVAGLGFCQPPRRSTARSTATAEGGRRAACRGTPDRRIWSSWILGGGRLPAPRQKVQTAAAIMSNSNDRLRRQKRCASPGEDRDHTVDLLHWTWADGKERHLPASRPLSPGGGRPGRGPEVVDRAAESTNAGGCQEQVDEEHDHGDQQAAADS